MKKSTDFDPATLLREHGFRATELRTALLTRLYESRKPLAALALVKQTRRLGADTATVYRALAAFAEHGLVRELFLGGGVTSYELVRAKHEHHIVCKRCGTLEAIAFCVRNMDLSAIEKSKQFKTIASHSLLFLGTCKKCARAVR